MRALFINGNRSGYTPEQCGKTMTVNDLIERLEEIRDWNDGGDIEFEDGVFEDYD